MMQGTRAGWESMHTWSPADIRAHLGHMKDLVKKLSASGELVLAEGLDLPTNTRMVTAKRADAPVVSDGPFAETKEFLAGFWIVDVETPQRAYQIAAAASTAPGKGGVPLAFPIEVRQVMSAPNLD
jgi:hypothetical protein